MKIMVGINITRHTFLCNQLQRVYIIKKKTNKDVIKLKTRAKPTPLTREQQKLIEDYLAQYEQQMYKCIHSVTRYRSLSDEELEDLRGSAYEGLCKAARNFKEDKGAKFETFAFLNVSSAVKNVWRRGKSQTRLPEENIVSLYSGFNDADETELIEIIDNGDPSMTQTAEQNSMVDAIFKAMNNFERQVTRMLMYNYTTNEICKELKCSPKQIETVKECTLKNTKIIQILNQYADRKGRNLKWLSDLTHGKYMG